MTIVAYTNDARQVVQDLKEIPELINITLEQLVECLPTYEHFRFALVHKANNSLRPHLVRIYEGYLHFCILAHRYAVEPSYKFVARTTISASGRHELEQCIAVIDVQAKHLERTAISLIFVGVEETRKTVIDMKRQLSTNAPGQISKFWSNVPGLLTAEFKGRDQELQWMRHALTSAIHFERRRIGLYGMTGIGKTQLMLKYEERFHSEYTSSIFLTSGSQEKLIESVNQLVELLELPERGGSNPAVNLNALRQWLRANTNWLLLIDNVGDLEYDTILDLLSSTSEGHVILTSQRRGAMESITGRHTMCLEITEPSVEDCVDIFFEGCGMKATVANRKFAQVIVRDVGYLPHAVKQCASYIKENGIDLEEYLDRYSKAPEKVLGWQDSYSKRREPISKHFVMILQHLRENHVDAANLLRLFSVLQPEAIPVFDHWCREQDTAKKPQTAPYATDQSNFLNIIARVACCISPRTSKSKDRLISLQDTSCDTSETANVVKDNERLYKAIAKLVDFSLVRRLSEKNVLWMHDLTRRSIGQSIPDSDRTQFLRLAIQVLYHSFPKKDNTLKERLIVDAYLNQSVELIEQARKTSIVQWDYVPLMVICAQCMRNRGNYPRAIDWFKMAMPEYQRNFGNIHSRVASLLHNMALTYHEASDLDDAEKTYVAARDMRRQLFEEDSVEVLDTMNKLAACIERQGRLKEGEAMFDSTYKGFKQRLGIMDPITLAAAHNLALCFANQGRVAEAEVLYRETLQRSEDAFGPEDFGTLKTLGNLAVAVDQSGRLDEAEPLYQRALAAYTKLCGADDMLTLRVRSNIACLYRQQGRFADAETSMRDAVGAFVTIFGDDHFHTAVALYDLGEILLEKGALDKSQGLLALALEKMNAKSAQHPLTFRVLDALGILHREAGNLFQADYFSALACSQNEALLGRDDPFTLVAANNRAEYLHVAGQYQESWDLYVRCLDGFRKLLPARHPHILMVLNNLGRLSWLLPTKDPWSFFLEALADSTSLLGPRHRCTVTIAMNIARTKFSQGNHIDAETAMLEVLELYKVTLGVEHPYVGTANFHCGMCYASTAQSNDLLKARSAFLDASDCFLKAFGPRHPNYIMSVCMLVRILQELQQSDDAETYRSVLETIPQDQTAGRYINVGDTSLTYMALALIDTFDWKSIVSLPFGETIRLRWGRKNVWREPEPAILED